MVNQRGLHEGFYTLIVLLLSLSIISLTVLTLSSPFRNNTTLANREPLQKGYYFVASPASSSTLLINQSANHRASNSSDTTALPLSLTDIFKRIKDSVVQITSTISNPNEIIIINGKRFSGNSTALGSGFIYDTSGHIVTNSHVVPESSNNSKKVVDVAFTDGNTYKAKVIGRDPFSDIAVLQLIGNFSDERLVPLSITNSSTLQVGQQVIAIGNPFGLSGSMTTGIISQMARLLPNPDTGYSIANTIQTSAVINPGNSGGPLLNMEGRVIGMNTAIISDTGTYSGVGFAIPSDDITRVVPILIRNGSYSHPWLGITGGKILTEVSNSTGLPKNYKGVMISTIQAGSPADKAGLRGLNQTSSENMNNDNNFLINGNNNNQSDVVPDIIIALDGHPVRQIDEIINYLDEHKSVGDPVVLKINRDGKIFNVAIVLAARHITPISLNQNNSFDQAPPVMPQLPNLP